MKKYIPNIVTLLRILLAPFAALTFFLGKDGYVINGHEINLSIFAFDTFTLRIIAVGILIVAELTDALDGALARKLGAVSDAGKILDPFADSVYRFTMFATFAIIGYMPLAVLLIFFYRDSVASMVRILSALKGVAMGARISGKIKAWVQAIAMFVVMALDLVRHNPWQTIELPYNNIILITLSAAAAFTLYSGIDYLVGSSKIWNTKGDDA